MRALVFDTETTGLIDNRSLKLDKQPEVIEFYGAIVNLKTGKKAKEVEVLIRPSRPITEEITKITGITNEDVAGRKPFAAVSPLIEIIIDEAPVVVAHNLSFDKEMLDLEFERLGRKLKWPRGQCTVEATVYLKGYRLRLSDKGGDIGLHHLLFGENFPEAHRAKSDTQALIRCCVELFKRGLIA